MTLGELAGKIDNDIDFYVIRPSDAKVVFRRKHASDVIPENLLNTEVGAVLPCRSTLYIYIKRSFNDCNFRELLNHINNYEHIDVYVAYRDGTKEKIYSDREIWRIDEEYDNYSVKRMSLHKSKWGDPIIDIAIEPCEESIRVNRIGFLQKDEAEEMGKDSKNR